MRMKLSVAVATCVACGVAASGAKAEEAHGDISPTLESGVLKTNGFIDESSTFVPNVRVFGYEFGEVPEDPFGIADPGFNALGGSGLTASHRVGIQFQSNLGYWDGTGLVAFTTPPASESLNVEAGLASRNASGGAHDTAVLFFGSAVSSVGGFHAHIDSLLRGSDGNSTPAASGAWGAGDSIEATTGMYLIEARLALDADTTVDGSTVYSPSFWLVYNNGLDEELHGEAVLAVRDANAPGTNIIPEPAALGLLGLGGMLLGRRRR